MAGFSNGANCQAVLLDPSREGIPGCLPGFVSLGRRNMLDNFKALSGKSLFVLYSKRAWESTGRRSPPRRSRPAPTPELRRDEGRGPRSAAGSIRRSATGSSGGCCTRIFPEAFRAMTEAVKTTTALGRKRSGSTTGCPACWWTMPGRKSAPTREAFGKMCAACDGAAGGSSQMQGTLGRRRSGHLEEVRDEMVPLPGIEEGAGGVRPLRSGGACGPPGAAESGSRKFLDEWEGFRCASMAVEKLWRSWRPGI